MERVLDLHNRLVCCVNSRTGYVERYDRHTLVTATLPVSGELVICKDGCFTALRRENPETMRIYRGYMQTEEIRPE